MLQIPAQFLCHIFIHCHTEGQQDLWLIVTDYTVHQWVTRLLSLCQPFHSFECFVNCWQHCPSCTSSLLKALIFSENKEAEFAAGMFSYFKTCPGATTARHIPHICHFFSQTFRGVGILFTQMTSCTVWNQTLCVRSYTVWL